MKQVFGYSTIVNELDLSLRQTTFEFYENSSSEMDLR